LGTNAIDDTRHSGSPILWTVLVNLVAHVPVQTTHIRVQQDTENINNTQLSTSLGS